MRRYFTTNTFTTRLPQEFIKSSNKKQVRFMYCKMQNSSGQQVIDACVHANWPNTNLEFDNLIGFTGNDTTNNEVYDVSHSLRTLKVWFSTISDPYTAMDMTNKSFILKIELIY